MVALLAGLAVVFILVGTSLSLIEEPGGAGESVSFFSCQLEGCGWLSLSIVGGAAAIAAGGLVALLGRREWISAPVLLVGGSLVFLTFFGWFGFFGSLPKDFSLSTGAGGPMGMVGGLMGVTAGLVGLVSSPREGVRVAGRTTAVEDELPVERPAPSMIPAILAFAGGVLVVVASFVPYARFGDDVVAAQDDLAIFSCGFAGCGWYGVEPIGLAITTVGFGVVAALGVFLPRAVVGWVLVVLGLWSMLLFTGFAFSVNEESFGTGSSGGPAGLLGIVAGLLVVAGGLLLLLRKSPAPAAAGSEAG